LTPPVKLFIPAGTFLPTAHIHIGLALSWCSGLKLWALNIIANLSRNIDSLKSRITGSGKVIWVILYIIWDENSYHSFAKIINPPTNS
jgi:hypothetical protein